MVRTRLGLGLLESFMIMSLNAEACSEMRQCGDGACGPIIKEPRDSGQFWLCLITFNVSLCYNFCLTDCPFYLPNFETLGHSSSPCVFSWGNGTNCQNWEWQVARGDIFPLYWLWNCNKSLLKYCHYLHESNTVKVISWESPVMPLLCISLRLIIYLKTQTR